MSKLIVRPFEKLDKTEKGIVTCCYTFAGVTFVIFCWSFNPVLLALSFLGYFSGTMVKTNREFLEGVVKQSYSPPITEEEVNDFSDTFDANTEPPNENPSNNQNGGTQMNPILIAIGLIALLFIILLALTLSPLFVGIILVLALSLGFTGYRFGKGRAKPKEGQGKTA